MARGESIGDLYIDVHANTRPFSREVSAKMVKHAARRMAKAWGKEFDAVLGQQAEEFNYRFRRALARGVFDEFRKDGEDARVTAQRLIDTVTRLREDNELLPGQSAEMKRGIRMWRDQVLAAEEQKRKLVELRKETKKWAADNDVHFGRSGRAIRRLTQDLARSQAEIRSLGRRMNAELDMKNLVPGTLKYVAAVERAEGAIKELSDRERSRLEGQRAAMLKQMADLEKSINKRIEIDVDLDEGTIAKLRERLRVLREQSDEIDVGVSLDDAAARARLAALTRSRTVSVDVDVDTKRLGPATRKMTKYFQDLGKRIANAARSPFSGFASSVQKSFSRMDNTVRAVLLLILALGPQMAALGSALSSQLIGAISSAVVGLGGALVALGPAAAGGVWGIGLLVRAVKDLEKNAPLAKQAWSDLNKQIGADAKDFSSSFAPAIGRFADTLTKLWREDEVGLRLGEAFASIVNSFTEVIKSPGYMAFQNAMETTIPDAIAKFGDGFASVMEGVLRLLAAAAPYTEILSERFAAWGDEFAASMGRIASDGTFQEFMDQAMESLKVLNEFGGTLMDTLGSLFMAAAPGGDEFLRTLTDLTQQFGDFIRSTEGQEAFAQWAENGKVIFDALLEMVGALGKALSDMVTPDTVQDVVTFFGQMTDFLPVLGEVLTVIGSLDLLTLVGQALNQIGQALEPVLPVIKEFAVVLGDQVSSLLQALQPALVVVAEALGALVRTMTPAVEILGELLVEAIDQLMPLFNELADFLRNTDFSPLMIAFEALATIIGTMLTPLIGPLVEVLSALVGMMEGMLAPLEAMTPVFLALAELIGVKFAADIRILLIPLEILANLLVALTPNAEEADAMFRRMEPTIQAVADTISSLIPYITDTAEAIANLLVPSVDQAKGAIEGFTSAVGFVINPLGEMQDALYNSETAFAQWARNLFGISQEVPAQVAAGVNSTSGQAVDSTERMAHNMYDRVEGIVRARGAQLVNIASAAFSTASGLFVKQNPAYLSAQTQAKKAADSWREYSAALDKVKYSSTGGGGGGGGAGGGGAAKAIELTAKEVRALNEAVREGLKVSELVDKQSVDRAVKALVKTLTGSLDKASKEQQPKIKAAIKSLLGAEKELEKVARQRGRNAAALEKAKDRLREAIDLRNDFRDNVRGAAMDFASALTVDIDPDQALVASDVITNMKDKLGQLREFFADVKKLRELGLNDTTLQEIILQGADGAGALADALAEGGASAVEEINKMQQEVESIAEQMGKQTASWFYQAGIDAARGLKEGLESEQKSIEKTLRKMVKGILDEVKKELGIKSPSREFAEIARQMVRGLQVGWDKELARVEPKMSADLALGAHGGGASASAPSRNVTVAPGAIVVQSPVSDPTMVANSILDRLTARFA